MLIGRLPVDGMIVAPTDGARSQQSRPLRGRDRPQPGTRRRHHHALDDTGDALVLQQRHQRGTTGVVREVGTHARNLGAARLPVVLHRRGDAVAVVTPPHEVCVLQGFQRLLHLRDNILDSMNGVAKDTLRSRAEGSEASAFGMHQADAGSDAYDRDFALSLLSQEQDALYEIELADGATLVVARPDERVGEALSALVRRRGPHPDAEHTVRGALGALPRAFRGQRRAGKNQRETRPGTSRALT